MAIIELPTVITTAQVRISALSSLFPACSMAALEAELKQQLRLQPPPDIRAFDLYPPRELTLYGAQALAPDKLLMQAQKLAATIIDQAICAELSAAIVVASLDESDEYSVLFSSLVALSSAEKIISAVDPKYGINSYKEATRWEDKAPLETGACAIYHDIYQSMVALSHKLEVSLSYLTHHLTLVLPATHLPFLLAHTGSYASAWETIKAACPKLELVVLPELTWSKEPCALLICNDATLGHPGYLALAGDIQLQATAANSNHQNQYILQVPAQRLIITNPECIAVLTGI